jgi:hypothetical protein
MIAVDAAPEFPLESRPAVVLNLYKLKHVFVHCEWVAHEVVEEENKAAVAPDELIEALDLPSEPGDLAVQQQLGVKAVFGNPLASFSHFLQIPGGGKVFHIFHEGKAHP